MSDGVARRQSTRESGYGWGWLWYLPVGLQERLGPWTVFPWWAVPLSSMCKAWLQWAKSASLSVVYIFRTVLRACGNESSSRYG